MALPYTDDTHRFTVSNTRLWKTGGTTVDLARFADIVREDLSGFEFFSATEQTSSLPAPEDHRAIYHGDLHVCGSLSGPTITALGAPGGSVLWDNVAWVDATNGNDGTAVIGDVEKPFLTILAAVAAITTPAQVIWLRPGTHNVATTIAADKHLTFMATDGQTAIVKTVGPGPLFDAAVYTGGFDLVVYGNISMQVPDQLLSVGANQGRIWIECDFITCPAPAGLPMISVTGGSANIHLRAQEIVWASTATLPIISVTGGSRRIDYQGQTITSTNGVVAFEMAAGLSMLEVDLQRVTLAAGRFHDCSAGVLRLRAQQLELAACGTAPFRVTGSGLSTVTTQRISTLLNTGTAGASLANGTGQLEIDVQRWEWGSDGLTTSILLLGDLTASDASVANVHIGRLVKIAGGDVPVCTFRHCKLGNVRIDSVEAWTGSTLVNVQTRAAGNTNGRYTFHCLDHPTGMDVLVHNLRAGTGIGAAAAPCRIVTQITCSQIDALSLEGEIELSQTKITCGNIAGTVTLRSRRNVCILKAESVTDHFDLLTVALGADVPNAGFEGYFIEVDGDMCNGAAGRRFTWSLMNTSYLHLKCRDIGNQLNNCDNSVMTGLCPGEVHFRDWTSAIYTQDIQGASLLTDGTTLFKGGNIEWGGINMSNLGSSTTAPYRLRWEVDRFVIGSGAAPAGNFVTTDAGVYHLEVRANFMQADRITTPSPSACSMRFDVEHLQILDTPTSQCNIGASVLATTLDRQLSRIFNINHMYTPQFIVGQQHSFAYKGRWLNINSVTANQLRLIVAGAYAECICSLDVDEVFLTQADSGAQNAVVACTLGADQTLRVLVGAAPPAWGTLAPHPQGVNQGTLRVNFARFDTTEHVWMAAGQAGDVLPTTKTSLVARTEIGPGEWTARRAGICDDNPIFHCVVNKLGTILGRAMLRTYSTPGSAIALGYDVDDLGVGAAVVYPVIEFVGGNGNGAGHGECRWESGAWIQMNGGRGAAVAFPALGGETVMIFSNPKFVVTVVGTQAIVKNVAGASALCTALAAANRVAIVPALPNLIYCLSLSDNVALPAACGLLGNELTLATHVNNPGAHSVWA